MNGGTHCLRLRGACTRPEFLAILKIGKFDLPLLSLWASDCHHVVAADVSMDPACAEHEAKCCEQESVKQKAASRVRVVKTYL